MALEQASMPDVTCPFCGVTVHPVLRAVVDRPGRAGGFLFAATLVECPRRECFRPFLAYVHFFNTTPPSTMQVMGVWPPPIQKAPDGVPGEIGRDYVEAHRCLAIGAHVAAALMARRIVEAACKERGATQRDLVDKIKELGKANKIHPLHVESASAARLLGKDAAHLLRDITKEEVEALFKLLHHFLEDLYTTPLVQKEIHQARQQQKQ